MAGFTFCLEGHVTAGNLWAATSLGCVSFVIGYFPDFFVFIIVGVDVGMVRHFPTL